MGNFKPKGRGGFESRGRGARGGRRFEGRDDFEDRDSRRSERSERRPHEMHDVICDNCGKECQVPFKPTTDKPIFCSDCFRKVKNSGDNFSSKNQDRPSQGGISQEQFNEINSKLDKIIQALEIEEEEDLEKELE